MKIKRMVIVLLVTALALCLSACGGNDGPKASSDRHLIMSTTFAGYDWAKHVVAATPGYEIKNLTDSGVDLHSFNPTAATMAELAMADVIIYVGGPSDEWINDAIKNNKNPNLQVVCLMDVLKDSIVEEELKEGMMEEEEEEEGPEYDEHVWMSIKNAVTCTNAIKDAIAKATPENEKALSDNAESYIDGLTELNKKFEEATANMTHGTVVVCDRFPFRYMFDDYKIDYYAAFPGCSAESEASFETVVFLAEKVKELNVNAVCVLEGSPQEISKTVIESSGLDNVGVVTLNSLQSVTAADVEKGATYISIMTENLEALKKLTE